MFRAAMGHFLVHFLGYSLRENVVDEIAKDVFCQKTSSSACAAQADERRGAA